MFRRMLKLGAFSSDRPQRENKAVTFNREITRAAEQEVNRHSPHRHRKLITMLQRRMQKRRVIYLPGDPLDSPHLSERLTNPAQASVSTQTSQSEHEDMIVSTNRRCLPQGSGNVDFEI
ncbi:unnamed protein product [Pleuronectes platessa]|uniref:Uncharacterized protein n=1 Tax=Pleuronectes platessa TaxID=8262 RepID=A0A9N7VQ91_PLEPL|nr:unnamed protein product [Pleuronectes platessa]